MWLFKTNFYVTQKCRKEKKGLSKGILSRVRNTGTFPCLIRTFSSIFLVIFGNNLLNFIGKATTSQSASAVGGIWMDGIPTRFSLDDMTLGQWC